ncbi:hypothetical protein GBA52_016054 [Prunus armeniaca]|nr:hypothetical protein GBA52_016054 [Prunus armeniaca]
MAHLKHTASSCTKGHYLTPVNDKAHLHPSSCLNHKPEWVIYNDCVMTSRKFIRKVTQIPGEWFVVGVQNKTHSDLRFSEDNIENGWCCTECCPVPRGEDARDEGMHDGGVWQASTAIRLTEGCGRKVPRHFKCGNGKFELTTI